MIISNRKNCKGKLSHISKERTIRKNVKGKHYSNKVLCRNACTIIMVIYMKFLLLYIYIYVYIYSTNMVKTKVKQTLQHKSCIKTLVFTCCRLNFTFDRRGKDDWKGFPMPQNFVCQVDNRFHILQSFCNI